MIRILDPAPAAYHHPQMTNAMLLITSATEVVIVKGMLTARVRGAIRDSAIDVTGNRTSRNKPLLLYFVFYYFYDNS
jgi:hypothetical protein